MYRAAPNAHQRVPRCDREAVFDGRARPGGLASRADLKREITESIRDLGRRIDHVFRPDPERVRL